MMFASTTVLCHMVKRVGLPAGLRRLTSRFDIDEYGVVYAELMDSQLDEQL